MNTQELMTKVFELAGEPSDLCPYNTPGDSTTFDTTLTIDGAVKLLSWLNEAVIRICNWQYGDGHIVRIKNLFQSKLFTTKAAITATVASATSTTLTIAAFSPLNQANQFDGWIVETTAGTGSGQKRLVIATSGTLATPSTLTVHKAWDTALDGTTTIKLYKRFFTFIPNPTAGTVEEYHLNLDAKSKVSDVLKVRDIEGASDLEPKNRSDQFTASILTSGLPSLYTRFGNKLLFDTAYDAARAYELLFYAYPTALVAYTDEPDLPVSFHMPVILWATQMIQKRMQDFNGSYATYRTLVEMMQSLRNQGAFEGEYEAAGFAVWG